MLHSLFILKRVFPSLYLNQTGCFTARKVLPPLRIVVSSASTRISAMFEQKIKFLNINLNALNERCTFSSGDPLTGNISFELSKETTVTSITMAVKGKAHVHWSSGSGRNRRNYTANLDFFKLQGVIVRGNSAAGGTKLQAGTHVYPFTCQLPQGDFPTSFHGVHGQIVYTLTVSIHRPWHLSKDIVTELSFLNRIDINQPVLSAPLSGRNSMTVCFLWCASGPITVTASSEKKAFTPGETAKIICDFSNASSRLATPKLKLKQKQGFYTHNRVSRRIYFKTLNSSIGQPISPHTTDVHTEFMLTIPSSASLTISNCDILEVEYFIEVSLKVSYSFEVTVMIPIILCDTPVDPQPPQYSSINVCI